MLQLLLACEAVQYSGCKVTRAVSPRRTIRRRMKDRSKVAVWKNFLTVASK